MIDVGCVSENDINKKLNKLQLKRSKLFGIGKQIGSKIWFHVDCIDKIANIDISIIKKHIQDIKNKGFNPKIIRIDMTSFEIAFIECNDFDVSNEPIVGRVIGITKDGIYRALEIPQNPLIYHHKWLMVDDDYNGFNVLEAKKRSLLWKTVLGVNRSISSKIGRYEFWNNWIKQNGIME